MSSFVNLTLSRATFCTSEIDWENAKIVGRESRWTQRKCLEGIETLREKNKGVVPLNAYNQLTNDNQHCTRSSIHDDDVKSSDIIEYDHSFIIHSLMTAVTKELSKIYKKIKVFICPTQH